MASFMNRAEDVNMDKEKAERAERDRKFANDIKKRMLNIVRQQIIKNEDEKTATDLIDLYGYIVKIKPDLDELFIYDHKELV